MKIRIRKPTPSRLLAARRFQQPLPTAPAGKMPENGPEAATGSSMPSMTCPECSAARREHPQPFQDGAGRWVCGCCWHKFGIETEMLNNPIIQPLLAELGDSAEIEVKK